MEPRSFVCGRPNGPGSGMFTGQGAGSFAWPGVYGLRAK